MTIRVNCSYRIIPTVRKHIVPEEALPCAAVGVCVEEALDDGVIISALQIVEPGFFGLSVAIEAKRGHFKLPKKQLQVGDKT